MTLSYAPQKLYLYGKTWTKQVDRDFLEVLLLEKNTNYPQGLPVFPTGGLRKAIHRLNDEYKLELGWEDIGERFRFLKKRYETFKWLKEHPSMNYNSEKNMVFARQEAWVSIFEDEPLAEAYYGKGEPEFEIMEAIFGVVAAGNGTP